MVLSLRIQPMINMSISMCRGKNINSPSLSVFFRSLIMLYLSLRPAVFLLICKESPSLYWMRKHASKLTSLRLPSRLILLFWTSLHHECSLHILKNLCQKHFGHIEGLLAIIEVVDLAVHDHSVRSAGRLVTWLGVAFTGKFPFVDSATPNSTLASDDGADIVITLPVVMLPSSAYSFPANFVSNSMFNPTSEYKSAPSTLPTYVGQPPSQAFGRIEGLLAVVEMVDLVVHGYSVRSVGRLITWLDVAFTEPIPMLVYMCYTNHKVSESHYYGPPVSLGYFSSPRAPSLSLPSPMFASFVVATLAIVSDPTWYSNNRATAHMTSDLTKLINSRLYHG
ncbi:hypothetical protein PVK06_007353 [Gossypium arboreum]|uniref:Uncharacterized protein n=1 Tax=Gossypium arboreum TaxID=29729 RepID=A0ABR0QHB2_GOSAR|nr:hypothetical protein PVK06_007353 [Gossypium arboreum]